MTDRNLEFIEQLFNAISNDPTMPADLKVSLLRLQLPIHQISETDEHFTSHDKHPARRTLLIAKRLSNYAKQDASLIPRIDHIIQQLTSSSATSRHFLTANQCLEQLIQQLETGSFSATTTQQKPEQDLKSYLNHKIRLCLQGQQVPNGTKLLALKLWPSALYYLLKTHGEKNRHWENAITMFCELLESLQPIDNIESYRWLKDNYMRIARVNNNMMLLYHNEEHVESAVKSLITYYNQALGNSNYGQALDNINRISVLDKLSSLPEQIKPGVWCEIYIDDVTPCRRLRLSYIDIEAGMLIFVNRKGVKKLEKDALDFSTELKRGLSKVYDHDEIFRSKPADNQKQRDIRKIS